MTAKNDITGDLLKSKPTTEKYESNYDRIFGKNKVGKPQPSPNQPLDNGEVWDEKRIDVIGSNGNNGEHYEDSSNS